MDRGPSTKLRMARTSICLEARKRMGRRRLCLVMNLDAPKIYMRFPSHR